MKFLILNSDYPEFLRWLYTQNPGLENRSYEEQIRVRLESLFGDADFYSSNLRKLGHEADDIYIYNEHLQRAWAQEQGMQVEQPPRWWKALQHARHVGAKTPLRYLKPLFRPVFRSLGSRQEWFYNILAAQIKHYKPDVLHNHAVDGTSTRFLREMKPYLRLLVGQLAAPLPEGEDFSCYDLVISSLPNFVDYFRQAGVPSELVRLGFEPRVLAKLKDNDNAVPISFVGTLSQAHEARVRLLEYLCARLPLKVWGRGVDELPKDSPIRRHHMGTAWGIEMYQILRNSKITLNHHIGVAGPYANNLRLYEATGVGPLLVTDWKENLPQIFEPGREVVAYRSPDECAELIQHYLGHDGEREAIARVGQEKTLREHTYFQRMQELVDIIQKHL